MIQGFIEVLITYLSQHNQLPAVLLSALPARLAVEDSLNSRRGWRWKRGVAGGQPVVTIVSGFVLMRLQ